MGLLNFTQLLHYQNVIPKSRNCFHSFWWLTRVVRFNFYPVYLFIIFIHLSTCLLK
jgi:hypothetical protein